MNLVYGKTGELLTLGPEIARGGEGAVYAIAGVNDRVAKVYLKPPSEKKIAKLRAMTSTPADGLAKIAAWPLDVVKDGGKVKGFVMPRLGGHEDVPFRALAHHHLAPAAHQYECRRIARLVGLGLEPIGGIERLFVGVQGEFAHGIRD